MIISSGGKKYYVIKRRKFLWKRGEEGIEFKHQQKYKRQIIKKKTEISIVAWNSKSGVENRNRAKWFIQYSMCVQFTTNFQLLPRLGAWDSQKREKELVLFPTNLTFFWDREILCASTQVGHLQVQLPLAGLCRLCCAWVSFPFSFFFFSFPPRTLSTCSSSPSLMKDPLPPIWVLM